MPKILGIGHLQKPRIEFKMRTAEQNSFTLVELIAVLAIAMLVAGLVTVGALRQPAYAVLQKSSAMLIELLENARARALLQNRRVFVTFDSQNKTFKISSGTDENKSDNFQTVRKRFPEEVEIEFPINVEKLKWIYCFYPDGTGSGPDTIMAVKQQKMRVGVSPLTGVAFYRDEKND